MGVEQRICINGAAIYKSDELVNIGHILHNGKVKIHLSTSRIASEANLTDITKVLETFLFSSENVIGLTHFYL